MDDRCHRGHGAGDLGPAALEVEAVTPPSWMTDSAGDRRQRRKLLSIVAMRMT